MIILKEIGIKVLYKHKYKFPTIGIYFLQFLFGDCRLIFEFKKKLTFGGKPIQTNVKKITFSLSLNLKNIILLMLIHAFFKIFALHFVVNSTRC